MENTKFNVSIEQGSDYSQISFEPLERGYGDTLGNALRRLLLSSIRGAAVVAVRIEGILHEFSTITGIREDVIELLMNLKHIPIKAKNPNSGATEATPKIITLDSDNLPKDFFTRKINPGTITARDMPKDSDFEFCGNNVLCTIEKGTHLVMEIYVAEGVGYFSAERERPSSLPIDALLTDAIFSPVKRVNYQIVPARVGQNIDYERLNLEVWTNGAVTPEEATIKAAQIAENYFNGIAEKIPTATITKESDKKTEVPQQPLTLPSLHDLGLSVRSENSLLRAGIQSITDLTNKPREEISKIHNLGKKSLTEIEDRLKKFGLELPSSPTSPVDEAEKNIEFSSTDTPKQLVDDIMKDVDALLNKTYEVETPEATNTEQGETKAPETTQPDVPVKPNEGTKKPPKGPKTSKPEKEEPAPEATATEQEETKAPVEDKKDKKKDKKPKTSKPEKEKKAKASEETPAEAEAQAEPVETPTEAQAEPVEEKKEEKKPAKKSTKKSSTSSKKKAEPEAPAPEQEVTAPAQEEAKTPEETPVEAEAQPEPVEEKKEEKKPAKKSTKKSSTSSKKKAEPEAPAPEQEVTPVQEEAKIPEETPVEAPAEEKPKPKRKTSSSKSKKKAEPAPETPTTEPEQNN